MPTPQDIYVNCDVLDNIPEPNRKNWFVEVGLLKEKIPFGASVMQIGSMDGTRAIHLLGVRPDLKITGLEIESSLVDLARKKTAETGLNIGYIVGDITLPPVLPKYDYVICLNNTLGYIPNEQAAIAGMKKLGQNVIISVYGEKFDDKLAREYFASIGLEINHIKDNYFVMNDFLSVKRFNRAEVDLWGGQVIETTVGYFCLINN